MDPNPELKMELENENTCLSYNVKSEHELANLGLLVQILRPKYIFIQEITLSTDQLEAKIPGYKGAVNLDPADRRKPGTAVLWRQDLLVRVVAIVPCRMQHVATQDGSFINIYPQSGTKHEKSRRELFNNNLFPILQAPGPKPIMVGDWNCLIRKEDEEPPANPLRNNGKLKYTRKISHELAQIVRDGKYVDAFNHINPGVVEYTWEREGLRKTRLDRVYIPRVELHRLVACYHQGFTSDHRAVVFVLRGANEKPPVNYTKSYWKLNSAVLHDEHFKNNINYEMERLRERKSEFSSITEWFDIIFKPGMKRFLIKCSSARKRTRADTAKWWAYCLNKALDQNDWAEVARLRAHLHKQYQEDALGLVVRSRHQERVEEEVASLYHLNREVKKGKESRLDKLARLVGDPPNQEREEITEEGEVEKEAVTFFSNLFQGFHRVKSPLNRTSPISHNSSKVLVS